jgi:KaiC/GvpD/RAD55 family RecA-like ATPase
MAVATVVALGAALAYITYQNSPEQVLKRTKERAEEAGAAAEEAAQQYAELKNSLDNLSSSEKALDELITGTQEWRDAVVSLNEEVLSLIEKYPELKDLIDFKDGHLTINYESEEGQEILKQ